MLLSLAAASLRRHRGRTILAVLGVAVSAAMLLDMVMLATGMRESFRRMIVSHGFELRIAPKGTLPFDSEATIGGASAIAAALAAEPRVARVSPVLGTQVHVPADEGGATTAFALGLDPRVQGDYRLAEGSDALAADALVANRAFLDAVGAGIGDTIPVAVGYDPQLRTFRTRRALHVSGIVAFTYLGVDQLAVALPLETLREMLGADFADRVSLVMVDVDDGADEEAVRAAIEARLPRVSVLSTRAAMVQVDERLTYFRQLAFILGTVSLVVGFLLVTTLMTVSVNERLGEIAVMRAIGVSRWRVVQQIVLEGIAISVAGATLGLALGLVTARYLNGILAAFPGLPASIDFFLFQPRAAWTALGMLVLAGVAAGIYPAWRGASQGIATTLRREAIA